MQVVGLLNTKRNILNNIRLFKTPKALALVKSTRYIGIQTRKIKLMAGLADLAGGVKFPLFQLQAKKTENCRMLASRAQERTNH